MLTYCRLSAHQFIEKLIQHILPRYFRAVRFYGLLANCISAKFKKVIAKLFKYAPNIELFPKWRERLFLRFHRNPLACPICGKTMLLSDFAYFSKSYQTLIRGRNFNPINKALNRSLIAQMIFNIVQLSTGMIEG
ncbi:MAG: transposase [Candidatus Omnitrophica bacterium]|nr:transposase [Candidatus Omnitrophota bacterium]